MKKLKRIGAMICVIALCFCMMAPSSNAQGAIMGQQFGAWIASALVSLNCIGQIIGGDFQSGIDAFHLLQNNIGVPTIQETIDSLPKPYDIYTFDDAAVSEALNTSTIKIRKGVTTIDGVVYDELWVSPEGAQKLKTNAFDFVTKYNLLTNDTSTLMTSTKSFFGVPFFNTGANYNSQLFTVSDHGGSYLIGDIQVDIEITQEFSSGRYFNLTAKYPDGSIINSTGGFFNARPNHGLCFSDGNLVTLYCDSFTGIYPTSVNWGNPAIIQYGSATGAPIQFDFVNGVIPAQETIPNDYGLSIKIPNDQLQTFYENYPQYNVDNSVINIQQDQIDIDELTKAIFDQIQSMEDIKAEWTNGEQPEPPAPVDLIENIDQNVEDISQYQADMQHHVEHMHQDVEAIHQTQQAQQQTQQDIAETSESIDSTLKEVKDAVKPGDVTPKKFDLRRLFPFCIPFDIYNFLQKFDAEPQAPHVQLPFVIESIGFNYMIDLDFSAFDGLAQTLRTLELIVYCIGLAWATSKVIKW